jgi:hypothetical protein
METTTSSETALFIKMAVTAWKTQNERVDKLLDKLSDDQLRGDIAPGKNSGAYLLGHLTAVNDNLLPLFGFSDKLYPELQNIFLTNPDKSGLAQPSVAELRKYWLEVNKKLVSHIDAMKSAEWFTRHNSVSEEDFAKEPHRNKLNVLLNRTSHQAYHVGQLVLLQKK